MSTSSTASEEAQAQQTIEMFEVIVQSDPSDIVSLEILKEAYFKLGRHKEVVETSKRIGEAYMRSGQLSSAILEYEGILQSFPDDPDVLQALSDIETRAQQVPQVGSAEGDAREKQEAEPIDPLREEPTAFRTLDDGRKMMSKIFVEGKHLSQGDFDLYWIKPNPKEFPKQVSEPFLKILADKQLVPLELSIKLVCERSRLCYVPLDKYDVDIDLARGFSKQICLRWCILPFDRMSKSILVATANPFNEKAARELDSFNTQTSIAKRFFWYMASPVELHKIIQKVFR